MLPIICTSLYSSKYNDLSDEDKNENSVLKEKNRLIDIINSHPNQDAIFKTSFKKLNNLYNDGFISGLYVIGANPGVGKTSFCLQLADDFVQNSYDVIYCSLEMSELELITKSLSRFSYIYDKDNAFSYNDILNNLSTIRNNEKLFNILKLYYNEVYRKITIIAPDKNDNFSITHLNQAIYNYKFVHKKKPVVIIDYLQLLKDYKKNYNEDDETMDSKNKIMKIVEEMKSLSKSLNIPIILISSLNRASYDKNSMEDLSLDCFKETGGIEYTADCAVVLTSRSIDDEKIEVNYNILKNRFGKAGTTVSFEFIPKYSFFEESSDDV